MSKPRYLTKSRFKIGHSCPSKLFYTKKEKEYKNTSADDPFLASLAEGGFQVGELAKCYHPGGHDITTLVEKEALEQTNSLLEQEDVIIYEPAIKYINLFIRVDVLVKKGRNVELIEVKAKSFDTTEQSPFLNKRDGKPKSAWADYLFDVAFQKYVMESAFPDWNVTSYLMMADKNTVAGTDGLNQKFRIRTTDGRKGVEVSSSITEADLKHKVLCKVNVDEITDIIHSDTYEGMTFPDYVTYLADYYERDEKINTPISTGCAGCEFTADLEDEKMGLKSGFKECWKAQLGWSDEEFDDQLMFNLWNYRGKGKLLEAGKYKLDEVEEEDISPAPDAKPGLSPRERQWMQVEKYKNNDSSIYFDAEGFAAELATWKYPLNFIDFETSMVAIPFNAGRRPYEGIAFQFSHHILKEDGTVEHKTEYLNSEPGVFPNYDFLRALKKCLEANEGTIFRYSNHENSFLNMIYRQLQDDKTVITDKAELIHFIKTITRSSKDSVEKWEGERCMVDQWDVVKRYYYDPQTNGSNSIKAVLPAILNSSKYLQDKYSEPVYGTKTIPSLNYKGWIWVKKEDGKVKDPYKLLPKMFQDIDEEILDRFTEDDEIRGGGAALTAYARMQFEEMSLAERNELRKALLKYCELDTMAMVMIHEGWVDMLKNLN
ncbi:MAG: DUF2779 domain-containing protein [Denitrovibrio sp.]|nr:MAG: DUF2779 domain-containing protein [Denitrovibrio sp.]